MGTLSLIMIIGILRKIRIASRMKTPTNKKGIPSSSNTCHPHSLETKFKTITLPMAPIYLIRKIVITIII
jgi:hypothetical protein